MTKENKQEKTTNSALTWGMLSALAASLCCIGPLALILLGVGGASTALSIGYRKPYFLVFGVIILGFGFYKLYRKSCETKHLSRKQQIAIFGGSFLAAALLYYLLTFVITPLIAPWVYQFRFGG
jgi:mercuric ion transport protein